MSQKASVLEKIKSLDKNDNLILRDILSENFGLKEFHSPILTETQEEAKVTKCKDLAKEIGKLSFQDVVELRDDLIGHFQIDPNSLVEVSSQSADSGEEEVKLFNVIIESADAKNKISLIKALKSELGLDLLGAKSKAEEIINNGNIAIKESLEKAEAEKLVSSLKDLAVVKMAPSSQ